MNWWYAMLIVLVVLLILVFIWQGMIGAKSNKIWTMEKMQKLIRNEIRQNLIDDFGFKLRHAKIDFVNFSSKRNYWSVIEKYLVEIHCESEVDNCYIDAKYIARYHTKIISRGLLEKKLKSLKLIDFNSEFLSND